MLCPACSAVISDTAKVCGYCGTRIVPVPPVEQAEERTPDEAPAETGAYVPALFGGPAAGEAPTASTPPEPASRRRGRGKPWWWIGGGALVVAGVVVSVLWLISSGDRDLAPAPPTTLAGQPPFVGGWQAVDDEGDVLFLWILPMTEADRFSIVSHDEHSAVCSSGAPGLVEAEGKAVSPSAVLQVSGDFSCLYPDGARPLNTGGAFVGIEYRHTAATDSMTDSLLDLNWSRVNTEMSAVFDPALLGRS